MKGMLDLAIYIWLLGWVVGDFYAFCKLPALLSSFGVWLMADG